MVIWVFAGGGESEVRGLIPFLRKHFPGCTFERKTQPKIRENWLVKKPDLSISRV